ncbi:MAG: ABC transporter permease [Fulvimonas sp.]|nr:ABC transporter permease [Fulvimonas sp.]
MKYLPLIWAALFRRKSRTLLTLVSIIAAFVLFGLLDSVRLAFAGTQNVAGAGRLVVTSRMSMQQPLPESLGARIAGVPGVAAVASANWFGGVYQDARNQVVSFAVSPGYLDLYPETTLSAPEREAWQRTRTGAVVGAALAKKYGWKVGDKIPLRSTIFPARSGGSTWTFDIVGLMHATNPAREQIMLFHWKYFDENNAFGSGTVHWYVVKVADPGQADAVAHAIDALSANSDHETRTQTEQAFQASFLKQLVNVGFIVSAIMGAVFFTLLLLTGNTMMQAVRERTSELAVLKTLGFPDAGVLTMVLAESVLLLVLGGVLGLALVALIVPALAAGSGGLMPIQALGWPTWLAGVLLMLTIGALVGLPPAWRAMRLNIVDALSGR